MNHQTLIVLRMRAVRMVVRGKNPEEIDRKSLHQSSGHLPVI